jgi:hypothetical protein
MHPPSEAASAAWSLPLLFRSGIAARIQPVTRGVPFPRGLLADPNSLSLTDETGRPVPLQTQTLARWPGGSVRWLLLDFLVNEITEGEHRWTLRAGAGTACPSPPLSVRDAAGAILVHAGALEFQLARTVLWLRARGPGTEPSPWEVDLGFPYPTRQGAHAVQHVSIAETGPVRATVGLFGGLFRGNYSYLARLSFFGGTGLLRVQFTARNPTRASHKGGLWDLGDRGSGSFSRRKMSLNMPEVPQVHWTAEPGQPVRSFDGESFELYQDSSGGENWQSRNHVSRTGVSPCSFRGYRVRCGKEETFGLRASPIVSLLSAKVAVTVAVSEFWQQFPKAIRVDGRRLTLPFFPWQRNERPELQGGEQKTHTVWLHFGPPTDADELPLAWVHHPVSVTLPPEWYTACGLLPCLPSGAKTTRLDALLNEVVDGPNSFFARREIIDEYGWRNYGEVSADHENAHSSGPAPVISHYNNQYDVVSGMLLYYFRTGDVRWWELADPLARHVIDIDIYHTQRDRAAYNGGLFSHTDHYRDAATCTHRSYSKANAPAGGSYGGGPSCEHNYTTGLLHYYYLTGDLLASEAVLELAEWVLRMDDGSRNILGLVDDGPTGLASATREPSYHGPGRGASNSVNALLDAWLLTGQLPYLDYAELLIRRCIHPADDIAARNLLDIENRWSYTVFLSVLSRYLGLKAEAGALDFMYAYGRASLLHYAAWMAENERPYFDQPDKLEFPTETWAAQELRKGNVLRLAAWHADEPLRTRLLQRGEEFAERGWSDLLRFESRTTARPLAIIMREGLVDLSLSLQTQAPAPRPKEGVEFGQPEGFVPQRQRVKAQMKSPRGLLRMGLRLLSPRRWKRYITRYRR